MQTLEVAKVILINEKGQLLLVRRSPSDVRRPGQWDIPGGHVDEGEDIRQAVVREAQEEAGVTLTISQLRLVYATSKVRGPRSITWNFFVAQLGQTPQVVLSEEHDAFAWMSPPDALQALEYDLHREMLTYATTNDVLGAA